MDCEDPRALAAWRAELLGWRVTFESDDEVVLEPPAGSPEDGVAPNFLFMKVPEGKTVKNRLHLDLRPDDQARGRTCYVHLAGRLGVAVTDAMTDLGLIDRSSGFALSDKGRDWFETALGIDTAPWSRSRRPAAKACLDWTEHRSHLAGLAGAALTDRCIDSAWIRRIGTTRAVRLTDTGADALRDLLNLDPEPLR